MTRKQKRLVVVFGALGMLGIAAALVLTALSDQVTFFRTPSELLAAPAENSGRIRLGGLVENGTVKRGDDTHVEFAIEDAKDSIVVRYVGILPDLFREGQGVIAEGKLQSDGTFLADTVLAKHDENYMPKEVADKLKEQGYWKGAEETAAR